MKRLFLLLQWVMVVAVVAAVAWYATRPSPPLDCDPSGWHHWDGFMVLSYAGVTREDNAIYPSSHTLVSHLEALQQSGYKTITTSDALAFLERRAPLPEKALLILFEGARKETFIRAHPPLRRLGMQATLCVPTESLENWDESRLKARDIHKLAALPQWSVASMGHEAVLPVRVSETDVTDHFLSSRQWLGKLKRAENDAEFRQRIETDYRESAATLARLNRERVPAYVYPFADNGRRTGADPLAAEVNTACVTSQYRMAFVSASNPYNPPGRNPFELSRLRIQGDVSAAQLLTALKEAQPRQAAFSGTGSPERWMFLNSARITGSSLRLGAGDAAWIKGSDLWVDADIGVTLDRAPGGTVACYARFQNPADCLRLTFSDKDVRLQESREGIPVTIAVAPAPTGKVIRVEWRVKGLRSWVRVDGAPLFGPAPLSPARFSGGIGFESSSGSHALSGLEARPVPRRGTGTASWASIPDERRSGLTLYLPPFPAPGEEVGVQQCLDVIQAVSEGATVWPLLAGGTNSLVPARLEAMAAMLAAKDLRPFVSGFVIERDQAGCSDWLRGHGFGVMHRVRTNEPIPVAATNRLDCVWLDQTGSNVMAVALDFMHRHPPEQVMARDPAVVSGFPGVGQVVDPE